MHIIQEFDTFSAFTHFASHTPSHLPDSARASRGEGSYRQEFTGTPSFADALRLAECGWAEGRERIAALSTVVFEKVSERLLRPDLAYDVTGDAWDMGRVLTGEPECAMRWELTDTPMVGSGKIVRLVVNATASWTISRDVLFTRGAAICALVDALEAAGRRCEVTVATSITGGERRVSRLTTRIIVKGAADPLQPESLAFALAHASMLRRLCFSAWETVGKAALKTFRIGLGHSYGAVADVAEDRGDIYLPAANARDSQWASVESARVWVLRQLHEQGVELSAAA